ncbi:MAG: putative methyl-accepting chemotaxis protein [Clostridia bacterium]|jgi:hypothetical protein|nr:putative methyl-accepting chemotaxis protein [Clostridia bacterium]
MLSLLLVAAISYTISYHLTLTNAKDNLRETSQKYVNEMNYWLLTQSTKLHDINEDIKIGTHMERSYLATYLSAKRRAANNIVQDYYIGFSDKSFIAGSGDIPPADYDCTKEDWYIQAIQKEGIIYTSPHIDEKSDELIMTIAEPIAIYGKTVGVIAADITIYHLIHLVNNIKIVPNSYAFLLNTDKSFITHIKPQFLPSADKKFYFDQVMNGRFKEISSEIGLDDISIQNAIDFDMIHKYFVLSTIEETNWALGFAIPQRELTKNLLYLSFAFALISILSIILSILAVILSINTLFKPLNEIDATEKSLQELNEAVEQVVRVIAHMSAHTSEAAASKKN